MMKKPRSAIGTVMIPSTMKSPTGDGGSEVINQETGRDATYTSTQRDRERR